MLKKKLRAMTVMLTTREALRRCHGTLPNVRVRSRIVPRA